MMRSKSVAKNGDRSRIPERLEFRRKTARKVALAISLLGVLHVNSSPAATNELPLLDLPQPKGPYAIGTKTLVLQDASRKRDLIVTTWFPAGAGAVVAPYMDPRTAAELAREWKVQPGFELRVRGHARLDARIVHDRRFPVVFLEHGSGVVPALYTVLAEGLASEGYVVVATNHPPD